VVAMPCIDRDMHDGYAAGVAPQGSRPPTERVDHVHVALAQLVGERSEKCGPFDVAEVAGLAGANAGPLSLREVERRCGGCAEPPHGHPVW